MTDETMLLVDSYLIGACGGFTAFGAMWLCGYGYLMYNIRRQAKVIREFRKVTHMLALSNEIEHLKNEVVAIRGFLAGS